MIFLDIIAIWKKNFAIKRLSKSQHENPSPISQDLPEDIQTEIESEHDPACSSLKNPTTSNYHIYEYHIVYREIIKLEEVWEDLPVDIQKVPELRERTFITQAEHPILGIPFFYVHPCQTSKLMKELLSNNTTGFNYILSWLSLIGPLVGLKIPFNWFSNNLWYHIEVLIFLLLKYYISGYFSEWFFLRYFLNSSSHVSDKEIFWNSCPRWRFYSRNTNSWKNHSLKYPDI